MSPSPLFQNGETALMYAAAGNNVEVLISSGASVDAINPVSIGIIIEYCSENACTLIELRHDAFHYMAKCKRSML